MVFTLSWPGSEAAVVKDEERTTIMLRNIPKAHARLLESCFWVRTLRGRA